MSAPDFDFAWSMAAVPRRYSQSTSGRSSSQVTARTVARSIAGQRSGGMGFFPEIQLATVVVAYRKHPCQLGCAPAFLACPLG